MRSSDCKSADLTANHSSPEQRPNRLSFGNRFSFFIYTQSSTSVARMWRSCRLIPKIDCFVRKEEPQNGSNSSIATSGNDIFGLKNEIRRNILTKEQQKFQSFKQYHSLMWLRPRYLVPEYSKYHAPRDNVCFTEKKKDMTYTLVSDQGVL